ncbi:putative Thioredoxin peroxidase [Blattamonas nauphoetae]|uniref:Thioredoxin peroxidase n=1 Tax=Blattamonas nauphoetae TaxID=2049346 RepID=A0ABQ9XKY7_9EUKA|nr:putative Thioredoxin peroxidase [Blattamonas nauphoetae]
MALLPGTTAPSFETKGVLKDQIVDFKLSDHKGKYVVLVFYPADFTFVCPTEILAFGDAREEFAQNNCELAMISTDSEHTHQAWLRAKRSEGGLEGAPLLLLADRNQKITKQFGVLIPDAGIAMRATYIIDGKGIIRHVQVNDGNVGRGVEETLRLVQAFQFSDTNGEVCPANWRKGKKTMKPTHDGVSKFLSEP